MSNRPDHYNTMKAEVCVVHECDLEKVKAMGGTLMTDAYAAYLYFNKLKDCTHVCCWSHVRRIFVSAFRDYKDALAQKFIDWIGLLYKVEVENQVLGRSEKEIVKYRGLEALPVLNDLYQEATLLLRQCERQEV